MTDGASHVFETRNYGRSITDDGWEKLEPEHIEIWQSALTLLNGREIRLPDRIVRIRTDWTPILRQHEKYYEVMKRLKQGHKGEAELRSILEGFPDRTAKIRFETDVTNLKETKSGRGDSAGNVIESFLHDCFLILNICAPGCCDFGRGTLFWGNRPTEIDLSNVHFEIALLGSFKKDWPKVRTLTLGQTIHWFESVRSGVAQIPKNPMEKTLFALLHIAKLDMNPMAVIWLFYAFESLFQTRVGENFSSLVQRIILLLELNDNERKILRRELRSLYSIRSAIVHGGFEVAHPMHDEVLDRSVDETYQKISDATDYGLTVLIAAIQNTILRGWRYPNFADSISGTSID